MGSFLPLWLQYSGAGKGKVSPGVLHSFVKCYYWSRIALHHCVRFCFTTKWTSCKYTYIPSLSSLPTPPHRSRSSQSTELSSLGYPAVSHSLFHTWSRIYGNAALSIRPTLSFLHRVHSLYLYSCLANRFICTIFLDFLVAFNHSGGLSEMSPHISLLFPNQSPAKASSSS